MTVRYQTLWSWALLPLAVFLGVASGFRLFGEGRDYLNYLDVYEYLRLTDTLDSTRFEPGYMLAAWAARYLLHLDYSAFATVLVSGAVLVKLQLFSKFHRPILTTIFYLCCWYPLLEYTQIRSAVAFSISLLAANFLFQGRFVTFAIAMGLATTFHGSALLLTIALSIAYVAARFSLPLVIGAIALLALVGESLSSFFYSVASKFNPLVDTYVANQDENAVRIFSGANLLTVAFLASVLFSRSLKTRKDVTFFILALFGLASAIAFHSVPIFSHRIKEMFLIFLVPLAFNAPLTKKTLPQYSTAGTLAAWSLYAAIFQGII